MPDVRFMTNLVNAAAKARRWVMASQLMQLMRTYGVPPNEVTYTCVLSQMSKAKQVREAGSAGHERARAWRGAERTQRQNGFSLCL